jgi:hypothetical protein
VSDVDLPTWVNLLLIAGAVAGSLAAMAALMVKTGRGVQWLKDAVRDGVADVAREQAVDQAAKLRAQVEADNAQLAALIAEVRAEVKPNGGTSLRDVLDRVELKLDSHIGYSQDDRADLRRWLETLDPERTDNR